MLFIQMASGSPGSPPLKPGMPAALHSLLAACLRPEPQTRPSALSALSTLTRAFVAGLTALAAPPPTQLTIAAARAVAFNSAATVSLTTAIDTAAISTASESAGTPLPAAAASFNTNTTSQQQQPSVAMVAQIFKVDPATLFVVAEPVAIVPLVDVKAQDGRGAGTVNVSGRLQREAVLAGLASLNIPEPNLRLLMRKGAPAAVDAANVYCGSELVEVSMAQLSGEGLLLQDILARAVAAAVKLPESCRRPTAGLMPRRPGGAQRRPLPMFLGFGQRSDIGLTPGGECHMWARPEPGQPGAGNRLDLNVEIGAAKSLFVTTCGEALLLDLKRMVEEREGIPVCDQRLAIGGRPLDDDFERLAACGLKSGDILDLC